MTSLNDFATTYMCQSLPFGGVKHSGFDRFAGIEGLRGMCIPKVCGVAVPLHALFACGTLLQGERGGGGAFACRLQRNATVLALPPLLLVRCLVSQRSEDGSLATTTAARCFDTPPHQSRSRASPRCTAAPVQAVAEDRWPFKTAIPPLLQYPVSDRAFDFVSALVWMFYAPGWAGEHFSSAHPALCTLVPMLELGLTCRHDQQDTLHKCADAFQLPTPTRPSTVRPSYCCRCRQCQGTAQPHCVLPAWRRQEGSSKVGKWPQGRLRAAEQDAGCLTLACLCSLKRCDPHCM